MTNELITRSAGRNAQIEALIDRTDLYGLVWQTAAAAVDAMLEDGTETHDGWSAVDAIDVASHAVPYMNLSVDDEEVVIEAVEAAIDMLNRLAAAPKGVVLVNGNNGHVWAEAPTFGEAKAFLDRVAGTPQDWSDSSSREYSVSPHRDGAVYRAVEIGLLGWDARDGERVAALGETFGYWLVRDTVRHAA